MRGSGRTTRQMLDAPKDAVFIWCNGILQYPRQLAVKHGRSDLHIVGPEWLEDYKYVGRPLTGVVVDHALFENAAPYNKREQWEYHINRAQGYIRK